MATEKHQYKRAVAKTKNQWLIDQCKSGGMDLARIFTLAQDGTKDCWDAISRIKKTMTKTKASAERNMKKSDGSVASTPQEKKKKSSEVIKRCCFL